MKASAISAIASASRRCGRSSKTAAKPPDRPLLHPQSARARACAGHPRLSCYGTRPLQDVDDRAEPGQGVVSMPNALANCGEALNRIAGETAMIEFLMVADAPTPVAPFSHATAADGWLFATGQMPTDPADDSAPLPEGIEAQTRRVIDNLKIVLAGTGSGLDRVVFARV